MISQMSLMVKVIGQRSTSPGWKSDFWSFRQVDICRFTLSSLMMWHDIMVWRHDVMWSDGVTSWHHLTSLDKKTRRAQCGRARQCSDVFIWALLLYFIPKYTHCKTGWHDLTSFRSEEYTRNVFFLKKSCLYLCCNSAILSVPESYVQGMVQGLQNWNNSLSYKAFAVLVSILHEKCKGFKTP